MSCKHCDELEKVNEELLEALQKLLDNQRERARLDESFQNGIDSCKDGNFIDNCPYEKDDDAYHFWVAGWLEEMKKMESEEMRNFIRFNFQLWKFFNQELNSGTFDLDELIFKTSLAPARSVEFMPELIES